MVDEHAEPPSRGGAELADDGGQVVDAVQRLDDDALDAQVVAPDLLDELGVVLALDVDPALAGDPGAGAGDVGRAGGAAGRRDGRLLPRADEHDRAAVDPEARAERIGADLAEPVLEVDDVLLAADDGADEAGTGVLDDQVALGLDLRARLLDGAGMHEVVVRRTGRHLATLGTVRADRWTTRRREKPRRDTPGSRSFAERDRDRASRDGAIRLCAI